MTRKYNAGTPQQCVQGDAAFCRLVRNGGDGVWVAAEHHRQSRVAAEEQPESLMKRAPSFDKPS